MAAGFPAIVKAQNISVKRRGTRGGIRLREDSLRPMAISETEFDARFRAIDFSQPVSGGMRKVEYRRGGRLITKYVKDEEGA